MEINVLAGSIQAVEDEMIVVNLFEGVDTPGGATAAVDQALGGVIGDAVASGDFKGKKGEVIVFYAHGALPARRVLVVGLGPQDKFGLNAVREAAAAAAKRPGRWAWVVQQHRPWRRRGRTDA